MRETILDSVPVVRVEREHILQQINSQRIGLREQLLKRLFAPLGQGLNELHRLLVGNIRNVIKRRCPKHRDYSLDLVQVILTREQCGAAQELAQNAADAPNVDGLGVLRSVQNYLWGSVPTGDHVSDLVSTEEGNLRV